MKIPASVTFIGESAFSCAGMHTEKGYLSEIYYEGSKEQWDAIEIGEYNDFSKTNIVYNVKACQHKWNVEPTIIKKSTCTEKGREKYVCTICGKIKIEEIPQLDHKYGKWEVIKDATCDENGKKVRECSICGETDTEVIEALGHSEVIDAEIPATCTEEGKTEGSHCERCGKVLRKQENTPVTDHKWSDWKVMKEPTCVDKGSKTRVCNDCGVTESVDMEATGHRWEDKYTIDKEATCTADGSKSIHCSVCGISKDSKTIPATGHRFGKWQKVQEATVFAKGSEKRKCLKCNKVEKRTIAKLKPTIKVSKTNVKIKVKKSIKIKVSNLAKGDSVRSWKTSNKKIVTVSKNGTIRAKKKRKSNNYNYFEKWKNS